MTRRLARGAGATLIALVAVGGPFALGTYVVDVATELLVLGLFALSLDLMFGHADLHSFGHAALFGAGGYAAAMAVNGGDVGFWLGLLAAIGAATAAGVVMALFAVRGAGAVYVILTLLLSYVLFTLAHVLTWLTGGENGIYIARPILVWGTTRTGDGFVFYWLVLALTAATLLACVRLVRSPFGRVVRAIRENEARAQAMGYNTFAFKLVLTLVSAAVAGLAGGLNAYMNRFVSPESLGIVLSTQVVIWVLLGGAGTLIGPMIGAAILVLVGDVLGRVMQGYLIVIGFLFIVTVIFAPGGLVGVLRPLGRIARPAR